MLTPEVNSRQREARTSLCVRKTFERLTCVMLVRSVDSQVGDTGAAGGGAVSKRKQESWHITLSSVTIHTTTSGFSIQLKTP